VRTGSDAVANRGPDHGSDTNRDGDHDDDTIADKGPDGHQDPDTDAAGNIHSDDIQYPGWSGKWGC